MPGADFPTSPEALESEWLHRALQRAGALPAGARITGFHAEALGEGAGLIGQVCMVELHYAEGAAEAPARIIAKFPTASPENRAVADTYDMYRREVHFYAGLAGRAAIATPRCWFASLAPDSSDFALLLEDISDRRLGDQTLGCGAEDARTAVDALAKFHAAHWGAADDPAPAFAPPHSNPAQAARMAAGFRAGWPRVEEQFSELVPPEVMDFAPRVPERVGALLEELCRPPLTLVHADYRLDNIFFAAKPAHPPVTLIDWQSIAKARGPLDLAYFLTQSVQLPERRRHERELVQRYHAALCAGGARNYSFEDCWLDYRRAALYLLCYAVVIAGTLELGNERGIALARALLSRSCAAIADLRAGELLPA